MGLQNCENANLTTQRQNFQLQSRFTKTGLGLSIPCHEYENITREMAKVDYFFPQTSWSSCLPSWDQGDFPFPRACSMTASEAARNEEVKSSHFRSEWSKARAAGRPGSQAPLHPRSLPRFCSDPPHPNPLPSEDLTGPFPVPVTPRETQHPAAHRGEAPLSLPRLSKICKHPALLSHGEPPPRSPFAPQPLPPHLQSTSDLRRVPTRPSRKLLPFRTCLRTCPPGKEQCHCSSGPYRGKRLEQLVPLYRILRSPGGPPEF